MGRYWLFQRGRESGTDPLTTVAMLRGGTLKIEMPSELRHKLDSSSSSILLTNQ